MTTKDKAQSIGAPGERGRHYRAEAGDVNEEWKLLSDTRKVQINVHDSIYSLPQFQAKSRKNKLTFTFSHVLEIVEFGETETYC